MAGPLVSQLPRLGAELDSYVQKGEALKAYKREAEPKTSSPLLEALAVRSQKEDLVDRRRVEAW